jgi:hypothetical protein
VQAWHRGILLSWFSDRKGDKAAMRMSAPMSRKEDLVVEDLADEVLIYDQRTDQAHCLNREAAMVWRVCDGRTSREKLSADLGLDPSAVARAIDELDACGLLESAPASGITRREATLRMAKAGGVAAAAPLIYSIMAPTPALAASQKFCLRCVQDCGDCHKIGCACCGPGNSTTSADKLCTADCTGTDCNPTLLKFHCNTAVTSVACNT